jgi:hypothetical protein
LNSLQQSLIKGKIDGKYEITLTFTQADPLGTVKGIIVYGKVNSPIPLSGTLRGNKVSFTKWIRPTRQFLIWTALGMGKI